MNNFFKYIFSIDTKSTNRIIIYFLGIRFRHLKPGIKKQYMSCIEGTPPQLYVADGLLRKVQLAGVKLLENFDKLCSDNNLEYWLDHGSMLGAVRHKGFIPWDDDSDVAMMRDDYEKLIALCKNGIDGFEDLEIEYNHNGKNKCFVKFKHKRLPNIAIDVFPHDFYYKKTNAEEKIELNKTIRKIISNKWCKLLYPFYIARPEALRKRFIKIRDKQILKGKAADKSTQPSIFGSIDYPQLSKNLVFDYEDIFPLKRMEFEGLKLLCANNTDKLLKMKYGNYMELPEFFYTRHVNPELFTGKLGVELDNFIK